MADQYFLNTPLLLPLNGANNSTTIENAGKKNVAITVHGNAKISDEQSVYGGSAMKLSGNSDFLTFPDVSLGTGDWTMECWVYLRSDPGTYAALMIKTGTGGLYVYGTTLIFYPYLTGNTFTVSLNTWHHVAAVRSADKLTLYLDGVASQGTSTFGGEIFVNTIGADGSGVQGSQSYIDDVRLTAGIARYVGNFTPPGAHDTTRPDMFAKSVRTAKKVTAIAMPAANFKHPHLAAPSRKEADLFYGGDGRISGVTKKKGTPDVAVSTRVRLFKERDGVMIRETWSDPVTGAYVFEHIAMDVKYTVLTYDHAHNFRAVVADNLTPELMA